LIFYLTRLPSIWESFANLAHKTKEIGDGGIKTKLIASSFDRFIAYSFISRGVYAGLLKQLRVRLLPFDHSKYLHTPIEQFK
jgi:hypothetical protein